MQAGTYFPKVRRMLLFHAPEILIHFWPASTLLRGHLALATVSSWDPQTLERWGYADEVHLGKSFRAKDFRSRFFAWRATTFVNFTRWIGFCMSEHFRKIDDNFGGSISWRPNPIVVYPMTCTQQVWDLTRDVCHGEQRGLSVLSYSSCFFNIATALLSPLDLFTRLFINLTVCIRALFPKTATHSWSCRTSIQEDAIFCRMSYCKFLWGNPCRAIETFYHWDFFLWDFGFSMIFAHSAAWKNSEKNSAVSFFARLLTSWRKLQLFPLEHCPLGFPLPTISKYALYTLFCPWISWPRRSPHNFNFWPQNFLFRMSCPILLFAIVFNLW